jgi:hypothetical protein
MLVCVVGLHDIVDTHAMREGESKNCSNLLLSSALAHDLPRGSRAL